MSNNIIRSQKWQQRRNHIQALELLARQAETLERHVRHGKCCEMVETGNNPHHDTHLCLRAKGHKGFHTDKNTGFTWKWESDTSA